MQGGRAVKECESPGGCFSGLCLSRARIASVLVNECWGSPALPGLPVHTSSGSERDPSKRGVTIVSWEALNSPSQHFQNFLLTLMIEAIWLFGWLGFVGWLVGFLGFFL